MGFFKLNLLVQSASKSSTISLPSRRSSGPQSSPEFIDISRIQRINPFHQMNAEKNAIFAPLSIDESP
jgi:hypothetical protein